MNETIRPGHAAAEALRVAAGMPSSDRLSDAYAYAQIMATIAVAEQARIANIVAIEALRYARSNEVGHFYGGDLLWDYPESEHGNFKLHADIAQAIKGGVGDE